MSETQEASHSAFAQVDVPVSEIMTRQVVSTDESMAAIDLFQMLETRGISGAPVRDAGGRAIGVVSKSDLLRAFLGWDAGQRDGTRAGRDALTVEQVMTCFPIALPLSAPIGQVAALLAYEGVHRVVVVDQNGVVAGIVTALDIARWIAQQAGFRIPSSAPVAESRGASPAPEQHQGTGRYR